MQEIVYQKPFGHRKRSAIAKFVRKVRQEVRLSEKPKATFGPEGQIIVLCPVDTRGSVKENAVRHAMGKATQQVLDSNGIWVIGIPEKAPVVRKPEPKTTTAYCSVKKK